MDDDGLVLNLRTGGGVSAFPGSQKANRTRDSRRAAAKQESTSHGSKHVDSAGKRRRQQNIPATSTGSRNGALEMPGVVPGTKGSSSSGSKPWMRPMKKFKQATPMEQAVASRKLAHGEAAMLPAHLAAAQNFVDLGVSEAVQRSLKDSLSISCPTQVQRDSIPHSLAGRDLLVKAPTGSGKTLAFSVPLLHAISSIEPKITREHGTSALIISPTRELCSQIAQVIKEASKRTAWVVSGTIMGGEKRKSEKARLRKGLHIVIGTPGRLEDHLSHTESWNLKKLKFLVLDEADRLLDMGFGDEVMKVIRAALGKAEVPQKIQSMIVSATLPKTVLHLASEFLKSPIRVEAKAGDMFAQTKADIHEVVAEDVQDSQASNLVADFSSSGYDASTIGQSNAEENKAVHDQSSFNIPKNLRQHFMVVPTRLRLATLSAFLQGRLSVSNAKIIVFVSSIAEAVALQHFLSRMTMPTRKSSSRMGGTAASSVKDWTSADFGSGGIDDDEQHEESGVDDDAGNLDYTKRSSQGSNSSKSAYKADSDEDADDFDSGEPLIQCPVQLLHGNLNQKERMDTFYSFIHAPSGVLVTTDVAARGLDFPGISWVIQFSAPASIEDYVHRIGRTARVNREGDALLMLLEHEQKGFISNLKKNKFPINQISVEDGCARFFKVLGNHKPTPASAESTLRFLLLQITSIVASDKQVKAKAEAAFQSFMRAHATHTKEFKQLLQARELHLGQVAGSFGLTEAPSKQSKSRQSSNTSMKGSSSRGGKAGMPKRPQRKDINETLEFAKRKARAILMQKLNGRQ